MTRSLAQDLRALAQTGPADPGAAIADRAGQMVRAIRRRRAARQTGMSAVGVSAAAVVVLGVTNGPAWVGTGRGDQPGTGTAASTGTPSEPTGPTGPTGDPAPTVPAPTASSPAAPSDDGGGVLVVGGLALVAERYLPMGLRCGAPFDAQVLQEAGATLADHLTPRFVTAPTAATSPVQLVNEYGRETPGPIGDGWSRMAPAVVVASEGVVVGVGGGALQDGAQVEVRQDFAVDLSALAMCPKPPASTVFTVYGIASEAGFDGRQHPMPPSVAEERLNVSFGLTIDLATGEQWFGEPADRATALADGLVPLP